MKWLIPFVALALAAQEPPKPAQEAPKLSPADQDLRTRVAEAGNSPVEFLRALEQHLELYASYAFHNPELLKKTIQLSEGWLGQVAQDEKAAVVKG